MSLINANIKAAELGPSKMKKMPTGGADRLMVTIGDALFGKWISKKLDSAISEKVFQKLLLLRSGADPQMVDDLITALASKEKVEREAIIERLRKGASVSTLKMDATGKIRPAAEDLEPKWKKLAEAADTPDAKGKINAAKEARLAFIVALFEAYNLAKSANSVAGKADDEKAWVVLAAASCSSAAAALDVYTNVAKGALEDSSLLFQKAKYLGAVFGAAGSIFSAANSLAEGVSQWQRDNKRLGLLHGFAALSTGVGGGLSFTAAVGYCGPLFSELAKRHGREVLRGGAVRAAAWIAARGFMYRAVFTGLSIALSIVGLGIQLAIWGYSDKALAAWIESCAFGIKPEKTWTAELQKRKLLEACLDQGVTT